MSHNPTQDYSHKELAKILGLLTYNLIAQAKMDEEKILACNRNYPVQAETQSQRETADGKDTQEELRQAKALLIRAETELKDRVAKAKAYERHLQSDPEKEIPNVEFPLTSGLIPPKQESTWWETFQETPLSSHSVVPNELDKLARNIPTFTPDPAGGYDIHAYLQGIDFHLQTVANVTTRDQLYLLRITSSREVRSFVDRQPDKIKEDYQQLQEPLIKRFSDPESEQGLFTALDLKQSRHETTRAYYNRLLLRSPK
ncbi:hypothetical protein Q7C36_013788 [Tachysurus vachellii]|uniref:Uncharacterized protein n=1 Tax=Tachysurus vachellii TaxID=175792 RepID=A0AA88MLL6_TACVA|nr:hypothetical protein Q7C36_013788 [Tachysurus vachellii]